MLKPLLMILISSALAVQAALPLVHNGQPAAEIVVDTKANQTVKFAAEELQHWIKEISGAKLPVVNAPGQAAGKLVLAVNPRQFPDDLKKLQDNDGYAVRTIGDTVYLFASCPKGILNGVYKLLYQNSDIIWARPNTEFGTIFTKNPNLALTKTDYIDIPVYRLRGWQMIGPRDVKSELWQARNGSNWNAMNVTDPLKQKLGTILEFGGGHNLIGVYIPEKKYFKSHPEFYPLRKGERLQPSKFSASVQLCFTNPELLKTFIQEVDSRVKANPQYNTYRIMIEDNRYNCECQECLKPITLPNGQTVDAKDEAFRSTQFFLWLNQIARHFQQHYSEKRVLTFAYFFTEIPPRCPVEPNIDISFCPIYKDSKFTLESPKNAATMAKFQGWLPVSRNLTWREYFGLTAPFPRPVDAIALTDWRYVNRYGVNRTYSEMYADVFGPRMDGAKSWDVNAPYFWVMTNGSWNPAQDVKALRQEFFHRVYGAGAADVAEYYRLIENQWQKTPGKSDWNDSVWGSWRKNVAEAGLEAPCRTALEHAAAKVTHPNGKKMLAALRNNFEEHMKLLREMKLYAAKVDAAPQFDPDFNSGEWTKALPADRFFIVNSAKPHTEKTIIRVLYDQKNLYFGVKCYHSNVKKMYYRPPTPDKNIFPDGEGFEIFLGGVWKNKPHFAQMVFDPNNNRYSAVRPVKWTSQTQVTADGWSGMAVIPWKEIGLNPANTKVLRGAFVRQFLRAPAPGAAPSRAASLFGGARHKPESFCDIYLQ